MNHDTTVCNETINGHPVLVIHLPYGSLPLYPRQGRDAFCGVYRPDWQVDHLSEGEIVIVPTSKVQFDGRMEMSLVIDAAIQATGRQPFENVIFHCDYGTGEVMGFLALA